MILIISNKNDLTVDYFISKIEKHTSDYFRLNTDFFITDYDFSFELSNDEVDKWTIKNKVNNKQISNDNISGIWYRRPELPQLVIKTSNSSVNRALMIEAKNYYENILRTINTNWVSHPDNIRVAENKILQLSIAKKLGFLIPDTLLSNVELNASLFCNKHSIISTKPLRNGSYTTDESHYILYNKILDNDDLLHLGLLSNYPAVFQKYIPKIYEIRVIIVHRKVFAVKIDSQLTSRTSEDWRVDNCHNVKYEEIQLPPKISKQCVSIVEHFGLNFSSMDLILNDDGNYYFLDLNPNGQWGWLDIELELGIAEALYHYLAGDMNE